MKINLLKFNTYPLILIKSIIFVKPISFPIPPYKFNSPHFHHNHKLSHFHDWAAILFWDLVAARASSWWFSRGTEISLDQALSIGLEWGRLGSFEPLVLPSLAKVASSQKSGMVGPPCASSGFLRWTCLEWCCRTLSHSNQAGKRRPLEFFVFYFEYFHFVSLKKKIDSNCICVSRSIVGTLNVQVSLENLGVRGMQTCA